MSDKNLLLLHPVMLANGVLQTAAETATGSTHEYPEFEGFRSAIVTLNVSAVSGTVSTFVASIDERDPVSGAWITLFSFASQVTAGTLRAVLGEGSGRTDAAALFGKILRASWTITGTTPSVTFTVSAVLTS